MRDWSAQTFEKYWLNFSELEESALIDLRNQFTDNQPELYDYVLTTGSEQVLSDVARSILLYMTLAIWDFISTQEETLIQTVSKSQILEIEKGNVHIFSPLESTDSFQASLMEILETYPAKELFLYIGQSISSRDLGREDRSITSDQRGWMILYIKVILDTLILNIAFD